MSLFQLVVITFFAYLAIYALIDRVCKCIEHCATARAFNNFTDMVNRSDEIREEIKKDD